MGRFKRYLTGRPSPSNAQDGLGRLIGRIGPDAPEIRMPAPSFGGPNAAEIRQRNDELLMNARAVLRDRIETITPFPGIRVKPPLHIRFASLSASISLTGIGILLELQLMQSNYAPWQVGSVGASMALIGLLSGVGVSEILFRKATRRFMAQLKRAGEGYGAVLRATEHPERQLGPRLMDD